MGKRWNGIYYNYNGQKEFEIKSGKGKGKEYNYSGELIFEGEYLNGDMWIGKRKEYNDYGKLEFESEYLNGEKKRKRKRI